MADHFGQLVGLWG